MNASEVEDAAKEVRRLTGGGVDVALEVMGDPETMGLLKVKEMVSHRFPLADINSCFRLLGKGDPSLLRGIVLL
ncbi:MAG: hypothetical protein LN412_05680 [Candidatus Thermoplasmatota archaeon]|nr:hypothetical protein [Candidatus Thermoplasmatota archaeon]